MAQVCAAEGCTQERTVVWQPWSRDRPLKGRHKIPGLPAVHLCLSHANAAANGTPFQFKFKAVRYKFDGEEIARCR